LTAEAQTAEAQIDGGSYSGFRLCATTQFFDRVKIIQNEVTAVRRTVKLAGFTYVYTIYTW
jgi:hypothetical protein